MGQKIFLYMTSFFDNPIRQRVQMVGRDRNAWKRRKFSLEYVLGTFH